MYILRKTTLFLFLLVTLFSCKKDSVTDAPQWKRSGEEIIIRTPAEPRSLNPFFAILDRNSTLIVQSMRQYLKYIDPESLENVNVLLASDPIVRQENKEGKDWWVYDLEIKEDARWDDGSSITGTDYLFTIKSIINPSASTVRIKPYLVSIKDIVISSDNPKKNRFLYECREPGCGN